MAIRRTPIRDAEQIRLTEALPLHVGSEHVARNLGKKVRIVARDAFGDYAAIMPGGEARVLHGLTVYADGSIEWESSETLGEA